MTPRIAILAVLVGLAAPGGAAQDAAGPETIRVRAGEHAGFSRLAFDLPTSTEWDVELDGRRLVVAFPDRRLDFDVRQIYPERRVTRVTRARQEPRGDQGSALRLTLSCDCEAEAYRFGEDMLVVDLRDRDGGSTEWASEPEAAASAAPRRSEETSTPERPAPPVPQALAPPPTVEAAASTMAGEEQGDATGIDPEAPVSVAEARDRLLRQLTRAADQGLIELREPESPPQSSASEQDAPQERDSDHAVVADTEAPTPTLPPLSDAVQLEARTAFDPLPWAEADAAARAAERVTRCDGEAWLDAAAWAGGEAVSVENLLAEVAQLRAEIVSELDRPSRADAVRLAELYLALGFGAEARQALTAFGPVSERAAWLRAAAAVLDARTLDPADRLSRRAGCGGRLGLWRLAAGFPPSPEASADEAWLGTVLDALETLPSALRATLAASAVETLIEADALFAAEALSATLDRAPGDHGDAWRLAAARLALRRGDVARAEATLKRVATGGGPVAERALLALTERDLAAGRPVPEARLERLGAAAFANRGTDLGLDLLVAEIRARAGKGELAALFDAATGRMSVADAAGDAVDQALRRALERLSAEAVGAEAYASAILANRRSIGEAPAWDPARRRIAEELTALGLPNAALDILGPAMARGAPGARLAAARAEAAMWRGLPALQRLEGLEGPAAAELRAEIHALAGRHGQALEAAANSLAPARRAALAFRAGRWREAAGTELDAARAALAEAMAGDLASRLRLPPADTPVAAAAGPFGPPSLAAAREAVARAARIRGMVKEILEDG